MKRKYRGIALRQLEKIQQQAVIAKLLRTERFTLVFLKITKKIEDKIITAIIGIKKDFTQEYSL